MSEKKFIGLYFLGADLILGLMVFVYNDFLCKKSSCYDLEVNVFEPTFFVLVGLLPVLIFLLFFSNRVFVGWLKHIAWWFLIAVGLLVSSNNHENDFSMFGSDNFVIGVMMTILFIITLVYALIMNRRLKKQGV
jgi:Na+/H+ antiporter NhaC